MGHEKVGRDAWISSKAIKDSENKNLFFLVKGGFISETWVLMFGSIFNLKKVVEQTVTSHNILRLGIESTFWDKVAFKYGKISKILSRPEVD